MDSIESKIEALTQELRPYPKGELFYYFDEITEEVIEIKAFDSYVNDPHTHFRTLWSKALKSSTNKSEVEEYADCYKRLKLYQLLGEKAEKEFPLTHQGEITLKRLYGTDFIGAIYPEGAVMTRRRINRPCVLGGVWFSREEDRIETLKLVGIDKAFQEKCAKFGLGGA